MHALFLYIYIIIVSWESSYSEYLSIYEITKKTEEKAFSRTWTEIIRNSVQ